LSLEFEKESIKIAVRSIRERKTRSILTVTGIVIGIAAIIALVSIGEGTNKYITEQFQQFGANRIIISRAIRGGFGATSSFEPLSDSDLTLVKRTRGVDKALPILMKSMPVEFKGETEVLSVMGIDSGSAVDFFSDIQSFELQSGRFIKAGDKYSVILGAVAAKQSFTTELRIRDKLIINQKTFEVVGILTETGTSQDDSAIIIPRETLGEIAGNTDEITYIFARVVDTSQVDAVAELIQKKMDQEHGEGTFTVLSTTKLAEQITTITGTLSAVLGGVAGIALVVAGIGIANTTYMSILERTKEIGIMKAIGATSTNILEIFLVEAAIIGLIGGLAGAGMGIAMSQVLGFILKSYGMVFTTAVTPELILMGVGFSILVGVVSGLLPARKAAKLNPIEALRYE
jgi:putative ABC transport system permease protein